MSPDILGSAGELYLKNRMRVGAEGVVNAKQALLVLFLCLAVGMDVHVVSNNCVCMCVRACVFVCKSGARKLFVDFRLHAGVFCGWLCAPRHV